MYEAFFTLQLFYRGESLLIRKSERLDELLVCRSAMVYNYVIPGPCDIMTTVAIKNILLRGLNPLTKWDIQSPLVAELWLDLKNSNRNKFLIYPTEKFTIFISRINCDDFGVIESWVIVRELIMNKWKYNYFFKDK